MSLFIDDGQTKRKQIDAVTGVHPAVAVEFRPALGRKRAEYRAVDQSGNPERIADFESDLFVKHVVSLDGEARPFGDGKAAKEKADRLIPALRAKLLDLILGYAPSDEAADAKN